MNHETSRLHDIAQRIGAHQRNVSGTERVLTGVGGGWLALSGLRHGGLGGLLGAAAGIGLLIRAATGYCPAYARLGSSDSERRLADARGWDTAAVTRESIVIDRPREALYRFWRDFTNLPRVMSNLERVEIKGPKLSHWVLSLPLGKTLEWDSTVTEDRPNERIAWQAVADADVPNSGWVEFRDAPGGQGTEITVELAYQPPAGELGRSLLKMLPQAPGALLRKDLLELRRRLHSGELSLASYGGAAAATASASLPASGPSSQHH